MPCCFKKHVDSTRNLLICDTEYLYQMVDQRLVLSLFSGQKYRTPAHIVQEISGDLGHRNAVHVNQDQVHKEQSHIKVIYQAPKLLPVQFQN